MKAIVINDKPDKDSEKPPFSFGEEVTLMYVTGLAIDLKTNTTFHCGEIAVAVEEYSICPCGCGDLQLFLKSRFAPISDEDNLQLSEEEAEAIRKRQTYIKWHNPNNDF